MRNSQAYWTQVCFTSILVVMTVCSVALALGQETLVQQEVIQPQGGFIWQSESERFRMDDGKDYSYDDIVNKMNATPGGRHSFGDDNESYPWIKLGKSSWMFKPDGTLYPCPDCDMGVPSCPPWVDTCLPEESSQNQLNR